MDYLCSSINFIDLKITWVMIYENPIKFEFDMRSQQIAIESLFYHFLGVINEVGAIEHV